MVWAAAVLASITALVTPAVPESEHVEDYVVALLSANPGDSVPSPYFRCAGVLVDSVTVMTAAHCVSGEEANLSVLVGHHDICSAGAGESVVAVLSMAQIGEADLARLTLERPAPARPASFAAFDPAEGELLTAAGWGGEDPGAPVRCEPRLVSLAVTALVACSEITASRSSSGREICALPTGHVNTCTGDSGGPVLDSLGSLVAVTSAGAGCGATDAGTYALINPADY